MSVIEALNEELYRNHQLIIRNSEKLALVAAAQARIDFLINEILKLAGPQ